MKPYFTWTSKVWSDKISIEKDGLPVGELYKPNVFSETYLGHFNGLQLKFVKPSIWKSSFNVLNQADDQKIGELTFGLSGSSANFKGINNEIYSWKRKGSWNFNWIWKNEKEEEIIFSKAKGFSNRGFVELSDESELNQMLSLTGFLIKRRLEQVVIIVIIVIAIAAHN